MQADHRARRRSRLRVALLLLVIAYGALLRFDALSLTYGAVEHPGWLRALQLSRGQQSVLRPDSFQWRRWQGRYISDPYTYLQYARAMRSFYDAHRREPVFPFATNIALRLLGDQDIAVSFASMFFSVLAIAATFLLGWHFSYWVGLGAAAALAIEYDMVTWGIGGWRDDAFMCVVVLSAFALVRYARTPAPGQAIALGVIAGLACLVRITSLSFLVPGLFWVLCVQQDAWKGRLKSMALVVLMAAAVAGPYVVNCWRTFGDPLYAINVHADIYRATEGQAIESSQTAAQYLRSTARARPYRTLETALLGMTSYPFQNKWSGFDRWAGWLGPALSWVSLAGLFLFLGHRAGQVYLVVLAGSLVPYALTWRLISDWRFTEHAYPFFLVAACFAIAQLIAVVRGVFDRTRRPQWPARTTVLLWSAAIAIVASVTWIALRVLPVRVAAESLRSGEAFTFGAGERDAAFFGDGWSAPVRDGNVTARTSTAPAAEMWLELPEPRDYEMSVRMDPSPRPPPGGPVDLPTVRMFVNGRQVSLVDLGWNPLRVGAYTVRVPAAAVLRGRNRLVFAPERRGAPAHIRLWYVRVRPAAP